MALVSPIAALVTSAVTSTANYECNLGVSGLNNEFGGQLMNESMFYAFHKDRYQPTES